MKMNQNPSVELPNPFRFENGEGVQTVDDWQRRRAELRDLIVGIEYGGLPPTPARSTGEELHSTHVPRFMGARYTQYRITIEADRPFWFRLDLTVPEGDGPFPVVLTGDGCWRYATDELTREVMRRGLIFAQFSRVEIVPDVHTAPRRTGLYGVYPDMEFGALAAWAWGYHRCVDFLLTLDAVDPTAIAAVGHSRGGKTALLAGATDERIALTAPNDSGSGGAGCYRWQGPNSETIDDNVRVFSYWYGPRLRDYVGRVGELPFDQHYLKALIAPRALLSTEALGDEWANPTGTWQTYLAAREVYRFLGADQRIGIWYREGGHDHGVPDWGAFLDFLEWQFRGVRPDTQFDRNPFPDLPSVFSWSAPFRRA